MRTRALFLVLAGLALLAAPASAVTIDWVVVGDPGNSPDTELPQHCGTGPVNCGSVAYEYRISKYEVTNAQYAEFLNAKAAADPNGLYNLQMNEDTIFGGITRSGSSGSYSYAVKPDFANKPVVYVSFWDAVRFANWIGNGQGTTDTETGAYTLTPVAIADNSVVRNLGATTFLPSENEWYKAAFYGGGSYFDYPTGTNSSIGCVAPGADTGNSANCNYATAALTDVGAYALSESPWGTYDQGGNVDEWNETVLDNPLSRSVRGGDWQSPFQVLASDIPAQNWAYGELSSMGFRVASIVPEPETLVLLMTGLAGLALRQRCA